MGRMARITASLAGGAMGLALLVTAVPAASAATGPPLKVVSGVTTVFVAGPTAAALAANGITVLEVLPGIVLPDNDAGSSIAATFPVTGGQVNLGSFSGVIKHAGGLDFIDSQTGKSLIIKGFDINVAKQVLTAYVPALKARAPIFDLGLTGGTVSFPAPNYLFINGISVALDPVAASALDSALGTTVFSGGLTIGSAFTDDLTS